MKSLLSVPRLSLFTLIALLGLSVPALAGEAPVNIQASIKPDRGYSSFERTNIGAGKTKVLYYRVTNTTNSNEEVELSADELFGDPAQYKVNFYKGHKPNQKKRITAMLSPTYDFNIKKDTVKKFSAKVKNLGGDATGCLRTGITFDKFSFDSAIFGINSDTCTLR